MSRTLTVKHISEYRYGAPVRFGRHRMMFRPRDSHSLCLLNTRLSITPEPQCIRWAYDPFGNCVAFAEFGDRTAASLRFESEIKVCHYEDPQPTSLLAPCAQGLPFAYDASELPDLEPLMRQHRSDPAGELKAWATRFVSGETQTLSVLTGMAHCIRSEFAYRRRFQEGTQEPCETLALRSGTCRDFALLMIGALRTLGFAARFVTGYIYSARRSLNQGGGATHAWLQVYLTGCGWVDIDPTNGIFGNRDLIPIAVARDHAQAIPLSGSFIGARGAYLGLGVSVSVGLSGGGMEAAAA